MENNNPLFSIITVSFNSVKTIEKTIISVLNQTYKNVEYIIIDGGSTDGTVNIIKKYQDKIKYWVSEPDKGISDAFNKGILVSHGYILGIINSDDWYEEKALETVIKLDKENNADFYVGALRHWDNNIESFVLSPDKNYKRTICFRMPHLNHPASFFKKSVYEEVGLFNLNYKYAMDYDLFLRAYLKNKKGIFTDIILSNMLIGGIANQNAKKSYKEVYMISQDKILGLIWYFSSLLRFRIKNLFK